MSDTSQLSLPSNLDSLRMSIFSTIQKAILDRRLEGRCKPKRPNDTLEDYDGINFSRKEKDLICLLLIARFSNIFDGFDGYILYEIELYLHRGRLFPIIAAAIKGIDVFLEILLLFYVDKCSPERIIRSILNPDRVAKVVKSTYLKVIFPRIPRRTIRRRGYNDHGSRRPDDKWLESYDSAFVEEQLILEQKRREYEDLVDRLIQTTRDFVSQKLD